VADADAPRKDKNLIAALFDFSFQSWVSLRVAGLLYGLSLLGIIATIVSFVVAVVRDDFIPDAVAYIAGPIVGFIAILVTRLLFESAIATIAIARNTESLRKQ
jgi:hypothetical protein